MSLAPEIIRFLEQRAAAQLPEVWETTVDVIRQNQYGRIALAGTREEIYHVQETALKLEDTSLPIRIYRPRKGEVQPAMIFFHGGGWVHNFLDIYEASLRAMANRSRITMIAVEYRKAPEHPFPIPFNDCYKTLEWCFQHADELGIDPTRIGVSGDSSGGNLAAAVALKAREVYPVKFQLLIYPCLDPSMNFPSAVRCGSGYGLSTRAMKWYWAQYLSDETHMENCLAAPSLAKSFSNLPTTRIITAEYDPLADDGRLYHERLLAAGVKSTHREYPGMIHGFFTYGAVTPAYSDLIEDISSWICNNT